MGVSAEVYFDGAPSGARTGADSTVAGRAESS
jgi:hypothetical protein